LIVKRGLYHKNLVTEELMELFMKPLKKSGGRKAFLHFAKCLNNNNLMEIAEDLKKLAMPVLIIRGDADPYLGAMIADRLHQEIPGSRLVRIATGGHWIQEDEPVQTAQALLNFFEGRLG
jgi:pimeloyl-ACP methyl ester carboxylesterase